MSFSDHNNPTPLRIGHAGTLQGRPWTVLGRVVLRTDDGYGWQEFYLGNNRGDTATLVHEDGDWKLFEEVAPATSLSVTEAAAKRVGDEVSFIGAPAVVDYVGASRVVHIEGVAPAGVETGDRARFFNATQGDGMLVVSWTGEEVEYFHGRSLPFNAVERAFGLPERSQVSRFNAENMDWSAAGRFMKVAWFVIIFVVFVLFRFIGDRPEPKAPEPPAKQAAPAVRLPAGAQGRLGDRNFTIRAHAVVEIARPAGKFDRHEYLLVDQQGEYALLVQGIGKPLDAWLLLRPANFPANFTPYDAAQVRAGKATTAEGKPSEVAYLFQSKARVTERSGEVTPWPVEVQYGFLIRTPDHWILTRWTEQSLQVYRGGPIGTKEVAAAFRVSVDDLGRP